MAKIKLNLTSGANVEKSLIIAFKVNEASYVVFDNEQTGSMGLPVILVCKYENDRIIKIEDQSEWQTVKEYLKNIIAGTKYEYINIPASIAADDIYYTQLTLPVPSFDALKNAYVVENVETAPTTETPTPVVETPKVSVAPAVEVPTAPVQDTVAQVSNELNNINPTEDTITDTPAPEVGINDIGTNINLQAPVVDVTPPVVAPTPEVNNINPQAPVVDAIAPQVVETPVATVGTPTPVVEAPIIPETPVASPQTITEPAPVVAPQVETPVITENMFSEQKEAFMQACENMFDALVQKFEKELEKKN